MDKRNKIIGRILSGTADANISFAEMCWLLRDLGLDERIEG